jgi:predicted phosphodiesterase
VKSFTELMKNELHVSTHWNRLAVIADIHSNFAALEAVLADIAECRCDLTIDLGDCVSGPLFPSKTAARLMALGINSVRGNHERQLSTLDRSQMGLSDAFADLDLTPEQKIWIAERPIRLTLGNDVLAVHGSPASDLEYLLETVEPDGCRPATSEEVEARLTSLGHSLILCGHTHLQRSLRLGDERLVVNPGSVGLPAYQEAQPFPHKNQSGSPHARYAIISRSEDGFSVEFRSVKYDWATASRRAKAQGRHDWVLALETGTA